MFLCHTDIKIQIYSMMDLEQWKALAPDISTQQSLAPLDTCLTFLPSS